MQLFAWLTFALCATHARAADAPAGSIDLRPYRVRIELTIVGAGVAGFSYERISHDMRDALDRAVGDMWQTEVVEDIALAASGVEGLRRLDDEACLSAYGPMGFDKAYRLTLRLAGAGYEAAGREWDATTRNLGEMIRRTSFDRREIPDQLVELLRDLFRPVSVIEQTKNGPLTLRAHGGSLARRDETWQPLREGMLYEAFYRYLNKDREVERIQQIPWTYLSPTDIVGGTSTCSITSGLRTPISARRRRIEAIAMAATRQSPRTRLVLTTRAPARRPLGGVEVEISTEPQPAAQATPIERLVSDRNGMVQLSPKTMAADAPVWLLVRSGQNLLARVPFVPGLRGVEVLELPDDSLRLELEGRVAQLQSELIDTVARRAVLGALVRSRAKAQDWAKADAYLETLAAMPGTGSYLAELTAVRLPGLKAARARKDRATELRMKKLCDDLADLIKTYLNEDQLKELREELAEFKTIAAEDAAAAKQLEAAPQQAPAREPRESAAPAAPARPAF